MEKGLAIIERNDTHTNAFFIDHEVVEFARLHAKTKKRLADAEKKKHQESRERRKAEKAQARRRAYTINTIRQVLNCVGIIGGAAWAGSAGLIAPVIYIPVIMVASCVACVRFGLWFGRVVR